MSEFVPEEPPLPISLPEVKLLPRQVTQVVVYIGAFRIIEIMDTNQSPSTPVGWMVLCPDGRVSREFPSKEAAVAEARKEEEEELKKKNAPSRPELVEEEEDVCRPGPS